MALKRFDELLAKFIEAEGSDLYLFENLPPKIKKAKSLKNLESTSVSSDFLKELSEHFGFQGSDLDTSYSLEGLGRFRLSLFLSRQRVSFVIRRIKEYIPSPKTLGIPEHVVEAALKETGLIVVSGSVGSGKSTTLASLIKTRNFKTSGHIVTAEDPIEYLHYHKGCIVSQREIGTDAPSMTSVLKASLRQAPDALMIGEVRTKEEMELALQYAEIGHILFMTLHAAGAAKTIKRILDFFPKAEERAARAQLASSLSLVISQKLVPNSEGSLSLATEVLENSERVKKIIEDKPLSRLEDVIKDATEESMWTFEDSLHKLYLDKKISAKTAMKFAEDPDDMSIRLRGIRMSSGTGK